MHLQDCSTFGSCFGMQLVLAFFLPVAALCYIIRAETCCAVEIVILPLCFNDYIRPVVWVKTLGT